MAAILVGNPIIQLWIILSLSFWFWGWCGTLFMTSTRVIFAASFDRVLPAWAADINERWRTPLKALMIMIVPAILVSYLYSFTSWFPPLVFDATVMIAVMYLGTAVAAVLLPYRRPELFKASTIADMKVAGIPLVSITGAVFGLFLLGMCIYWITNPSYGVNNLHSAEYLGVLLLIAVGLYVWARISQKRRGIDITLIHKEIPVE
jgi:amino acid transporter